MDPTELNAPLGLLKAPPHCQWGRKLNVHRQLHGLTATSSDDYEGQGLVKAGLKKYV